MRQYLRHAGVRERRRANAGFDRSRLWRPVPGRATWRVLFCRRMLRWCGADRIRAGGCKCCIEFGYVIGGCGHAVGVIFSEDGERLGGPRDRPGPRGRPRVPRGRGGHGRGDRSAGQSLRRNFCGFEGDVLESRHVAAQLQVHSTRD